MPLDIAKPTSGFLERYRDSVRMNLEHELLVADRRLPLVRFVGQCHFWLMFGASHKAGRTHDESKLVLDLVFESLRMKRFPARSYSAQ